MSLPWVRLDSNIGTHDKVLDLLAQKDGCKAFVLYVCALGYSGGHGTDGRVPKSSLTINHGNEKLARMLIEARLWEYDPTEPQKAYQIKNWMERQELSAIGEIRQSARRKAARKANCKRWHGADCLCWTAAEPKDPPSGNGSDGRT